MPKIIKLITALAIFGSWHAHAMLTSEQYERIKRSNPDTVKLHLTSVAEGLQWSNADLQSKGQTGHFCLPSDLSLNADNYMQLAEREVTIRAKQGDANSMPIGLALFRALERAFPCKK